MDLTDLSSWIKKYWVVFIVIGALGFLVMGPIRGQASKMYWMLRGTIELILLDPTLTYSDASISSSMAIPPTFIAHAGGAIKGLEYTNTLDAIENSYEAGLRFFELDFEWTREDSLVCIHDWEGTFNELYPGNPTARSYDVIAHKVATKGLKVLTLERLERWLITKNDTSIRIVSDVKAKNVKALAKLAHDYPRIASFIIPQIYAFSQYSDVRRLGFKDVIFTLYMSKYSDTLIKQFVSKVGLFAVTMPFERTSSDLPKDLRRIGVFVYVHTINGREEANMLLQKGASGFYTDSLGIYMPLDKL